MKFVKKLPVTRQPAGIGGGTRGGLVLANENTVDTIVNGVNDARRSFEAIPPLRLVPN